MVFVGEVDVNYAYLIWIFLAFATLFGFLRKVFLCWASALICVAFALAFGRLSAFALLYLSAGMGLAFYIRVVKPSRAIGAIGWTVIILWALALATHIVPGFENLKVLNSEISKTQSAPFTLYLNLDKPAVFFALLVALPNLFGKPRHFQRISVGIIYAALSSLLFLAAFLGEVHFRVGLPQWWLLFAVNNLLFTCVAEESFFRAFLQQKLIGRLGAVQGLVVASVLFGLAHLAGGWTLVIFATLAGAGYGLTFCLTGRLWAAVLMHFTFNFTHLAFFTYPHSI